MATATETITPTTTTTEAPTETPTETPTEAPTEVAAEAPTEVAAEAPTLADAAAYAARLGGVPTHEVAVAVGVTTEAVEAAVGRRVAAVRAKAGSLDEALAFGIDRCDALLRALWPQAQAGDLPAVDRVLKIEDRRDKLLGLHRDEARTAAFAGIDDDVLADLTPEELRVLAAIQAKTAGRSVIGAARSRGGRPSKRG
jgi:hypothetical protein